jgi:hypothetical protein
MGFDLYNCALKIWESIGSPTPTMGVHLGVWGFIPHTLCTPGNMWYDSWASLLARNLANPCLGHKPKARVATLSLGLSLHSSLGLGFDFILLFM